jgi:hypothetical protein
MRFTKGEPMKKLLEALLFLPLLAFGDGKSHRRRPRRRHPRQQAAIFNPTSIKSIATAKSCIRRAKLTRASRQMARLLNAETAATASASIIRGRAAIMAASTPGCNRLHKLFCIRTHDHLQ